MAVSKKTHQSKLKQNLSKKWIPSLLHSCSQAEAHNPNIKLSLISELERALYAGANPCKKKLEGQISRCTKSSAWINVGNSKGNSPKIYNLTDPVPLTFDLLNSKSIGFDRRSRTTTVLSYKSF